MAPRHDGDDHDTKSEVDASQGMPLAPAAAATSAAPSTTESPEAVAQSIVEIYRDSAAAFVRNSGRDDAAKSDIISDILTARTPQAALATFESYLHSHKFWQVRGDRIGLMRGLVKSFREVLDANPGVQFPVADVAVPQASSDAASAAVPTHEAGVISDEVDSAAGSVSPPSADSAELVAMVAIDRGLADGILEDLGFKFRRRPNYRGAIGTFQLALQAQDEADLDDAGVLLLPAEPVRAICELIDNKQFSVAGDMMGAIIQAAFEAAQRSADSHVTEGAAPVRDMNALLSSGNQEQLDQWAGALVEAEKAEDKEAAYEILGFAEDGEQAKFVDQYISFEMMDNPVVLVLNDAESASSEAVVDGITVDEKTALDLLSRGANDPIHGKKITGYKEATDLKAELQEFMQAAGERYAAAMKPAEAQEAHNVAADPFDRFIAVDPVASPEEMAARDAAAAPSVESAAGAPDALFTPSYAITNLNHEPISAEELQGSGDGVSFVAILNGGSDDGSSSESEGEELEEMPLAR
jgi:hypothetical protein